MLASDPWTSNRPGPILRVTPSRRSAACGRPMNMRSTCFMTELMPPSILSTSGDLMVHAVIQHSSLQSAGNLNC
eukprot:9469544-Pyramimonas_sp.AAC.1